MTPEEHVALVKNAGYTMLGGTASSEHYQRGSQSNFVEWQAPGRPHKRKVKCKLEPSPELDTSGLETWKMGEKDLLLH